MVDTTKKHEDVVVVDSHPLYRIGAQVQNHELRITILERDYAEIKEIKSDVKALFTKVGSLENSVSALPEQLKIHFSNELRGHEAKEARNQSHILWAILMLALSIIGGVGYLGLEYGLTRL